MDHSAAVEEVRRTQRVLQSPWASIVAVAAVAAVAFVGPAQGATTTPVFNNSDVEFYLKQNTFPDNLSEQKVYLNAGTGTTVTGQVGSQTGVPTVHFASQTPLDAANGFATIKGENDVPFYDLSITVPGYVFKDLIFNVDLFNASTNSLKVEAFGTDQNGTEGSLGMYDGFTDDSWVPGENEILVLAVGAALLNEIKLTSPSGFVSIAGYTAVDGEGIDQTKQFEISGVTSLEESTDGDPQPDPRLSTVPIPTALPLFGTGLGILGIVGWVKRRRRAAA